MLHHQISFPLLLLAPLLLNAGCEESDSGTPPYLGTYEVLSHTENTAGCDTEGDPVEGEATFFSLEDENFFGVSVLTWHDCESAESCSDVGALDRSFTKEGGEWVSQVIYAAGGVDCDVGITEGTIEETDSGVRIEFHTYSGVITVQSAEACETDLAEEHREELECTGIEVLEATLR